MPNLIYIGNLSAIDTDESNWTLENASAALGSYGNSALNPTEITGTDLDGNNAFNDDDMGRLVETVSYDLGAGEVTAVTDASSIYSADVLLGDGSTRSIDVVVIQMTNGDTFVTEVLDDGTLDNLQIQTITLTSLASDNYSGWYTYMSADNVSIVCFAKGTEITCNGGRCRVQDLTPGDMVLTLDNGLQPLRWISKRRVSSCGRHAPVIIQQNALGCGLPVSDLRVSPQHRILVNSRILKRISGCREGLIPAIKLVGLPGISQEQEGPWVTYYHLLFDRHEVIWANGTPTESLYLGHQIRRSLPVMSKLELTHTLPEISLAPPPQPARPIISPDRSAELAQRMHKNTKAPLERLPTPKSPTSTQDHHRPADHLGIHK